MEMIAVFSWARGTEADAEQAASSSQHACRPLKNVMAAEERGMRIPSRPEPGIALSPPSRKSNLLPHQAPVRIIDSLALPARLLGRRPALGRHIVRVRVRVLVVPPLRQPRRPHPDLPVQVPAVHGASHVRPAHAHAARRAAAAGPPPRDARHPVPDRPLAAHATAAAGAAAAGATAALCRRRRGPDARHLRPDAAQARHDAAVVQVQHQDLRLVGPEEQLAARRREPGGRREHGHAREPAVADRRAEAGERVGARRRVPDADAPVVARRHDVRAVVGPREPVDGPAVRPRREPDPAVLQRAPASASASCRRRGTPARDDAQAVFLVEQGHEPAGPPDVPYAHRAVDRAAGEDVLVPRGPRRGEDGACRSADRAGCHEGLDCRARPQVHQPHGRVLRTAGDQEVVRDRGDGVRVDLGAELEGCRELGGLRVPQLEGLVVRRREEGGRVEGVEGEVGDTEAVALRLSRPRARGRGLRLRRLRAEDLGYGLVGEAVVGVAGLLKIPEPDSRV
ncbi:uncharacterized protein E0L32_003504 [Thyridium curvatum]|uniref:Uncharacterized protein n=1 Tax=Thyridium curvatum TaxID=1093900 RepID=A0A507B3W0_9PEZI|nr:uncharacterized protein E0L32_003504 [Thyridium curvatum]TPX16942.1 hypothetical protein E0L32_003504 [Thyridium curvatum]